MEQEVEMLGASGASKGCMPVVMATMPSPVPLVSPKPVMAPVESHVTPMEVSPSISACQKNKLSPPAPNAKSKVPPSKNSESGITRKRRTPSPRSSTKTATAPLSLKPVFPGVSSSASTVVSGIAENEYSGMVTLANSSLSIISPLSPCKGQNAVGTLTNTSPLNAVIPTPHNLKGQSTKSGGVVLNLNSPHFQLINKPSTVTPVSQQPSTQPLPSQGGHVKSSDDHSSGIQLLCDLLYQDGALPGQYRPSSSLAPVPPAAVMTPTSLATPTMNQTTEKREPTSTHPPIPVRGSSPRRRSATPKSNTANKQSGRKRSSPFSIDSIVNSNSDSVQHAKVSRVSPVSTISGVASKSKTSSVFSISHLTKSSGPGSASQIPQVTQSQSDTVPIKGVGLGSYTNPSIPQLFPAGLVGSTSKGQGAFDNLSSYVISANASLGTKTVPLGVLTQPVSCVMTSKLDGTRRVNPPVPVKDVPKDPPLGTTLPPSASDRFLAKLLPLVTHQSLQGTGLVTNVTTTDHKTPAEPQRSVTSVPAVSVTTSTSSSILPNLESLVANHQITALPFVGPQVVASDVTDKQASVSVLADQQGPVSSVAKQQLLMPAVSVSQAPSPSVSGQQTQPVTSQQAPTVAFSTTATQLCSREAISQNPRTAVTGSEKLPNSSKPETNRESASPDSEVRSLLSKETMPQSPLSLSPFQRGEHGGNCVNIESRPLVLVDSNPCSSKSPIQLPTSPALGNSLSSLPSFLSVFSPTKETPTIPRDEPRYLFTYSIYSNKRPLLRKSFLVNAPVLLTNPNTVKFYYDCPLPLLLLKIGAEK